MKKILSVVLMAAFLAGGTVWAQSSTSSSGEVKSSKTHSHKKKSSKSRKTSKSKKKKKGKKSSKSKDEIKADTGVGKDDVEIDLKGQ
jgi:Ni/Co efflux regulator RcnB